MKIFHGSNIEVKTPEIIVPNRGLDFGSGFYTTLDEKQAKSFSVRKVRLENTGSPIVSIYEFDQTAAESELSVLKFNSANGEWLDFIVQNRKNEYNGPSYDIIYGPVADDGVMPTIRLLMDGYINKDEAIERLKPLKLTDQLVFSSEKSLNYLTYISSEKGDE